MTNDDVLKKQQWQREMVSALVDGQLRGQDFAMAVESIQMDFNVGMTWRSYQVIGDVLRSPELAEQARDIDFLARFQTRLASDADAQLAYRSEVPTTTVKERSARFAARQDSANESAFAWKLTAGVASRAAVVAIGWSMTNGRNGLGDGAQLAQGVAPIQLTSSTQAGQDSAVMLRDPNLDALLAAHKQLGGATALQMPTGFLRNATFEGGSR